MRQFLLCPLGLAVLWGCASNKSPSTRPTTMPVASTQPYNVRGDDYAQMQKVLTFTPGQWELFQQKLAERNAAFEQWSRGPRGQRYEQVRIDIAAARRDRDAKKLADLQTETVALSNERDAERARLRGEFNSALTLEQQRQWAGHVLYLDVIGQVRPALTDAQKMQAHRICAEVAAKAVDKNAAKNDPYLKLDAAAREKAISAIRQQVMSAEQRMRSPATQPLRRPREVRGPVL